MAHRILSPGTNMSIIDNQQHETTDQEIITDLMLPDEDPKRADESFAASLREIAARIPESLNSIGRDISRTIERAVAAKDEYVIAVKLSSESQEKISQLVSTGIFRNRSEAATFLIEEGIKAQGELFERVKQKLIEIERLQAELRSLVQD
ncbi:MAG: hypothetical protein ACRD4L_13915 [Pyrinomonadaceae bacterium]